MNSYNCSYISIVYQEWRTLSIDWVTYDVLTHTIVPILALYIRDGEPFQLTGSLTIS